eukprot:895606_1
MSAIPPRSLDNHTDQSAESRHAEKILISRINEADGKQQSLVRWSIQTDGDQTRTEDSWINADSTEIQHLMAPAALADAPKQIITKPMPSERRNSVGSLGPSMSSSIAGKEEAKEDFMSPLAGIKRPAASSAKSSTDSKRRRRTMDVSSTPTTPMLLRSMGEAEELVPLFSKESLYFDQVHLQPGRRRRRRATIASRLDFLVPEPKRRRSIELMSSEGVELVEPEPKRRRSVDLMSTDGIERPTVDDLTGRFGYIPEILPGSGDRERPKYARRVLPGSARYGERPGLHIVFEEDEEESDEEGFENLETSFVSELSDDSTDPPDEDEGPTFRSRSRAQSRSMDAYAAREHNELDISHTIPSSDRVTSDHDMSQVSEDEESTGAVQPNILLKSRRISRSIFRSNSMQITHGQSGLALKYSPNSLSSGSDAFEEKENMRQDFTGPAISECSQNVSADEYSKNVPRNFEECSGKIMGTQEIKSDEIDLFEVQSDTSNCPNTSPNVMRESHDAISQDSSERNTDPNLQINDGTSENLRMENCPEYDAIIDKDLENKVQYGSEEKHLGNTQWKLLLGVLLHVALVASLHATVVMFHTAWADAFDSDSVRNGIRASLVYFSSKFGLIGTYGLDERWIGHKCDVVQASLPSLQLCVSLILSVLVYGVLNIIWKRQTRDQRRTSSIMFVTHSVACLMSWCSFLYIDNQINFASLGVLLAIISGFTMQDMFLNTLSRTQCSRRAIQLILALSGLYLSERTQNMHVTVSSLMLIEWCDTCWPYRQYKSAGGLVFALILIATISVLSKTVLTSSWFLFVGCAFFTTLREKGVY